MLSMKRVISGGCGHSWLILHCLLSSSIFMVNTTICPTAEDCTINICVLIADIQAGRRAYQRYVSIIDTAIKHVNNGLLPPNIFFRKFHLPETPLASGKCIGSCAVTRALELLSSGINCHVFLGPDTPTAVNSVYGVAYTNNIPILSTAAYGIANRADARLLTLLFLNTKDIAQFLVKLLIYRNYTYVAILSDQSDMIFTSLGSEFVIAYSDYYSKQNQTDYNLRLTPLQFDRRVTTDKELAAFLSYARTRARVIVVFTIFETFKNILMIADELTMTTDDYEFFITHPYDDANYGSTNLSYIAHHPDQLPLLRALQGNINLISLKLTTPPLFAGFQEEVKLLASELYNYTFELTDKIDALTTTHYDAVILLANTVSSLYQRGVDFTDGILLSSSLKNIVYYGLQTGQVTLDQTGDSLLSYDILGVAAGSSEFTTIWVYSTNSGTFRQLREFTGVAAPDVPRCGFTGDALICQEDNANTLTTSLSATFTFIFIIAVVGWLSFRTVSRLKQQLDPNWWKINPDELHYPNRKLQSISLAHSIQSEAKTNASLSISFSSVFYQGTEVSAEDVSEFRVRTSMLIAKQSNLHRMASNENLQHFIGITVNKEDLLISLICEHCSKGDLTSLLTNHDFKMDWSIKHSFIRDLAQGMTYLHSTAFNSHGNLTSYNCLIDGRLTLKITGHGHPYFRSVKDLLPLTDIDVGRNIEELLWRAPELLSVQILPNGTQKGDVFSFGILLQQIILETRPYEAFSDSVVSSFLILQEVKKHNLPPTRPNVPRTACPTVLYELMEECWSEFPVERPSFEKICNRMKKTFWSQKDNIVDLLLKRMEGYANNLEAQVAEKTSLLVEEKRKSDHLLSMILPGPVANALIKGEPVEPESYDSVTIYFSDIVGFTTISAELTPLKVIKLLNTLYTTFDKVLEFYDAYKVETIGDAYMIVSGLPLRNGRKHIAEICLVALHIRDEMINFHVPEVTEKSVEIRIGLNTGSCVAGVVGLKMPRYCLFGDTVNTASRMETNSEPMKIHITENIQLHLSAIGGFHVEKRGEIEVKGKGIMTTYWLISKQLQSIREIDDRRIIGMPC